WEPSETPALAMDINQPVVRVPKMTLEKTVDAMLAAGDGGAQRFLIVSHGYNDDNDNNYGLLLPLTDGCDVYATQDNLKTLLDLLHRSQVEDSDLKKVEQSFAVRPGRTRKFPAGALSRLLPKLTKLRQRRPLRVEVRACNLGSNEWALELFGRVLGAKL